MEITTKIEELVNDLTVDGGKFDVGKYLETLGKRLQAEAKDDIADRLADGDETKLPIGGYSFSWRAGAKAKITVNVEKVEFALPAEDYPMLYTELDVKKVEALFPYKKHPNLYDVGKAGTGTVVANAIK